MQIYQVQGDTNMNDIYNNIKLLGGISSNPDDDEGIQLIEVYGKVEPSEIGRYFQKSKNIIEKNELNKEFESYYFENKVLGDNKSGKQGIKK